MEGVKSCLDLAMVSSKLVPFVKKMVIDRKSEFTHRIIIRRKDGLITIFTDHFSVQVMLEGLSMCELWTKNEITWNLNKVVG